MGKISVIVPIYKVEKYIHKCVDSILGQTFQDLEVILVDDGSPDSCGEICEEYAKEDSRVKVIHKENGGLSDARNAGLVQAVGEYVIFIDSDDYIEADMLAYLYENAKEAKAQVATCGAFDVYEHEITTESAGEELIPCSGEELYSHILRGEKVRGEIWNKLIKRELIGDIQFPKGKLYEDIFFTADLIGRVDRAVIGTLPKYYYLHRSGSITGKPYRRQLLDLIEGYEKAYQMVCKTFPRLKPEAECLKIWSRFVILDKILLEENYREIPELSQMIKYLKAHRSQIAKNPYFHPRRKLAVFILSISSRAYRQMVLHTVRKQSQLKE